MSTADARAVRPRAARQGQVSDLVTSEEQQPPAVARRLSARSTGQFGVIVFLASDVMLFAPFFAAYFLLRANNAPWPPADVELDVPARADRAPPCS